MYDESEQKAMASNTLGGCVEIHRPTLTERLKQERHGQAEKLAELDSAIAALESNPEVQRILDLVRKVARY